MKSREVQVFVRIRPTANFARHLIECLPDGQTVNIYHRKNSKKLQDSRKRQPSSWSFQLEGILQDVSQEEFYTRVCRRVVLGALDGYNGTVMCFGQTGAGKTYTMTGSTESYKQRGVIPRALQEVFQEVEKRTEHAFNVHLSYLEIYNETLVDLLSSLRGSSHQSPHSMVVMEEPGRGVLIRGLSLHPVHSEEEALNLLFEGEMNRIIGSHALNRNSSRSHCIFTVHVECRSRTLSDAKYVTSKLNLVDLAGSERLGKTGSEGQMMKEAVYINRSLSFLEQAILALADHRRDHVPFRQSKLTHALKDSLGGNCNTVLVANIYSEAAQIEETLSTLRFACRMKCVRTDPAVNERVDLAAQIKKLEKDVQMLKEELSLCNTLAKRPSITYESLSEAQLAEIHSQVQRYLAGSLENISIVNIRQVHAVFAQFKLAVQEQEQKVKAQLRQTYNLVKKDQSANTAAIKEWDIRSSTEDVEAGSTGVPKKNAPRPSSTKAKTKKLSEKQNQSKRRGEGSPVSRKHLESASKSKLHSVQTPEREHESQEPDTESQDTQEPPASEPFPPDSPPTKEQAFEVFKVGQGSKINLILKDNKAVLLERRSLLRQLSEEVNTAKREIDCTTATLQQHRELRGGQGQYLVMENEPPLQEAEITLLMQLRALKAVYRQRYEVLRDIKAEVNYCEHLVDQCRVRLLTEFESWYKKSFLVHEQELDITMEESPREEEDAEKGLPDEPSSESFYNARYRTLKRRNSRALVFTPVQRNSSGQRRLPPILPVT
ncbi:kinesin-like protein KIF9 isoform X1 [Larimichthys crocea]|uniref:kinesin-like protein KIF9 isoform X1 n=1 Tax=Larimichthys crocea TaxID=215358 RepID=UPI000F601C43|nr:kinesin-like protein KIF9 isoform X1 [Larimichthys crocea]XP_019128153.2 kinesin-like protein KIF9 isoform X1 [Larimichthys crocea]XP_027130108.1 kinesin-like protein KIF9 isoform X1 [Larimichthys crocea]XP_027130109.1 kinesin-like protein KIF9 isoform X1 [Larimichthys crocea]